MQVRCSVGLRCVAFGGCGGVQRTVEELELAAVDHHTNVTCLLKHEGAALPPNAKCYLQAALLYTTPNGQRSVGAASTRQAAAVRRGDCADALCCLPLYFYSIVSYIVQSAFVSSPFDLTWPFRSPYLLNSLLPAFFCGYD